MGRSTAARVLQIAGKQGVVRPRDLDAYRIPRKYLNRLFHQGRLERVARGLYSSPDMLPTEHRTLVEATRLIPGGVACLLTALRFHEMTMEAPFEVWMAIGPKSRAPRVRYPPLRIVRFSGPARTECVQEHRLEGVPVRVYTAAKTVADCFKYRNKIGLDVAMEALRDCWRKRLATMDEIWDAAKICRVNNVMRPYMEMVLS